MMNVIDHILTGSLNDHVTIKNGVIDVDSKFTNLRIDNQTVPNSAHSNSHNGPQTAQGGQQDRGGVPGGDLGRGGGRA